jgi:hypothetical protein
MMYKVLQVELAPHITASIVVPAPVIPLFKKKFKVLEDRGYVLPSWGDSIAYTEQLIANHITEFPNDHD